MKKFNITNLRKAVKWVKAQGWEVTTGLYWKVVKLQSEPPISVKKQCCPYTAFGAWSGQYDIDKGWQDKDAEIRMVNPDFDRAKFIHGFDGTKGHSKNKYYMLGVKLRKELKI